MLCLVLLLIPCIAFNRLDASKQIICVHLFKCLYRILMVLSDYVNRAGLESIGDHGK